MTGAGLSLVRTMNSRFLLFLFIIGLVSVFAKKRTVRFVFGCHLSGTGNPYERAWITQYLLADCVQQMICINDLRKAFKNGDEITVREFMKPGTVYFLQLDTHKLYSWYAEEIILMTKKYKASLKDFVLVHMTDNLKNNHIPLYEQFYKEWRYVIRNYWWNDQILLPMYNSGFLSYFPLGYSSHMHSASSESVILPPAERPDVMTFQGNSQSGNYKRAGHLKELALVTGYNVTGQVQKKSFGMGSPQVYREFMLRSKFCINIQGRFVECYRMYDALEVGCIVVMIDQWDNFNYVDRYTEQMFPIMNFSWVDPQGSLVAHVDASGTKRTKPYLRFNTGGDGATIVPFLYLKNTADFDRALKELLKDPAAMKQIQHASTLWWTQMKQHYRKMMVNKVCVSKGEPVLDLGF
jgi:hypothetical protein